VGETKVDALPDEAIIKNGEAEYIFILREKKEGKQ
jgi:hypothetical protein